VTYLPPDFPRGATAEQLQRRLKREQAARREAERLLESKSLELFELNRQLLAFNSDLEARVRARTAELEGAKAAALTMLHTDHLTGVGSRIRYRAALSEAIASGSRFGLVLIDLDGFKQVNDTFGHQVGDGLLCDMADRLRQALVGDDLVARIGGDEFALLIKRPDRGEIEAAAQAYASVISGWVTLAGHSLPRRASIGISLAPDDADTSTDLQRFADLALYQAKHSGGNALAVFDRRMLVAYEERQQLEAKFREAVAKDEIEVWYQPIVEIRTGRVTAIEALARWQDSTGSFVGPDVFIPLAERCGLIQELSARLFTKALVQAKPWVAKDLVERVTFNVSPLDLLTSDFADRTLSELQATGFPADHLVLEVTEGAVLDDVDAAIATMRRLTAAGVQFALDDFGSGYSNLSYVHRLPISTLKLDKSLLGDPVGGSADAIIEHVVALCRQLKVRAVCEGVETTDQAAFLRRIACEFGQGFLYYRPASVPAIERLLNERIGTLLAV
jgi:diguanylate cyclase (GGDEF)-like protein